MPSPMTPPTNGVAREANDDSSGPVSRPVPSMAVSRRVSEGQVAMRAAQKAREATKSDGPSENPFNPQDMYTARNRSPYRPYEPGPEPLANPSLQKANINPQNEITVMPAPNIGRTTGALYDFAKNQPTDNSELFNTDVSGNTARQRMAPAEQQ